MAGTYDAPQVLRLRKRVHRARFAEEAYERPTYNPTAEAGPVRNIHERRYRPRAAQVFWITLPSFLVAYVLLIFVPLFRDRLYEMSYGEMLNYTCGGPQPSLLDSILDTLRVLLFILWGYCGFGLPVITATGIAILRYWPSHSTPARVWRLLVLVLAIFVMVVSLLYMHSLFSWLISNDAWTYPRD
jgi:hypothetical protein